MATDPDATAEPAVEAIPGLFRRASDRFGALVEQVPDDRWGDPTPCTDWDVRALVNHLVNENLWAPELFAGETVASVGDRFDGDLLGDDPKAAWRSAAPPAVAAVEEPGAMARTVHLSFGDVPGAEYSRQLLIDLVVHGWDLARGAGLDERMDPDLAAAAFAWGSQWEEMLRSAPDYFDPPIEPSEDADLQTRLLNLFGRRR